MGLTVSGFGTILSAVNFITTIFCMRAPGMTMFRMPIFTWNALLTSMLVLLAFPVIAAALLVLEVDRRLGAHVFDASSGGPLLRQNLNGGSSRRRSQPPQNLAYMSGISGIRGSSFD